MIFKRLFSRRPAEATSQPKIGSRGGGVQNPRLDACHRLTDLGQLLRLAEEDEDAAVRELAQARCRHLLCGQETSATLDLAQRIQAVSRFDEARPQDRRLLEHLALEAREPEVRLTAIERLTTAQDLLAARALGDPVTRVRIAAAERLRDRPALEHVARHIGKKDKKVYRLVHGRLKELAEEEARPALLRTQAQALCDQLERLGRFDNWSQDLALFAIITEQWQPLADQAGSDLQARFSRECQRFEAAHGDYLLTQAKQADARETQAAEGAALEALIEDLHAAAHQEDPVVLAGIIQDGMARWAALGPVSALLDSGYRAALRSAQARLEALNDERHAHDRLSAWLASARATLDQSAPIDPPVLERLLAQTQALPPLAGPDQGLQAAVIEARGQIEERQQRQRHQAEQRLTQAETKLKALEAALAAGELKHAEPLYQSLQATIDAAEQGGAPGNRTLSLKGRLRASQPRLRELQQWRRWGADNHRQELCQAMEELLELDLPLAAKTERLKSLRSDWKALDREGSPVNHPLWERFQSAADRVYAQCQPWLEQRSQEREAARAAREAVCAQLESFLDQVDWTRVNWRQAQRAAREMRTGWEQLGEVDPRLARGIERRFRAALKRLDDRLSAERESNQRLKHELIARVRALAEAPDLAAAIDETKQLQSQWHTTVAARQREENHLWQEFRAACDTVFARRRQRYEAQVAELEENRHFRQAILAEAEAQAEALAQAEAPCPADLPADLEARWRDSAQLPLPRQTGEDLEQRWQRVRRRFQGLHRAQQTRLRQRTLDLLARQAQVCQHLEAAALGEQPALDVLASAAAAWDALPVQADPVLHNGMAQRYHQARDWVTRDWTDPAGVSRAAAAEANARTRMELCLGLEILAQIQSPAACAQERLAMQVSRLQEHLAAGERDPLAEASHLVERWYLTGPTSAATLADLEPRFQRALRALREVETRAGSPAPGAGSEPEEAGPRR